MKFHLLLPTLLLPILLAAQNTVGGKKVIVPESEVERQSKFLDAERERMLGHFDKATTIYKEFLLENPDNDAAFYGLARTQAARKDEVNALETIRRAIEIDPLNPWYQTFYADLLEKNGRVADAIKVYEKLTKTHPETPAFYQKLAYLAVLSGDPKGGLKALDRLEKLTGVTEETASKKYMIFVGLGDSKKAAEELRKLADAYPEEIEYRRRHAQFLDEIGEKAAARQVWQQVLKLNPDDPVAQIAVLEKSKSSGDEAYLDSLKPLFRDSKVSIDAKIKEVLPFFQKLEKAPQLSGKLLELGAALESAHPDDPKAWSLSGDLLYYSNRPDEALAKYRRSIELRGNVFAVWENAMEILAGQKNYSEMFKTAEKALDAFPNQAKAYYYYGVAATETGRLDDAISQLEQATLMDGNNLPLRLEVVSQLGQAMIRKKDFDGARARLEATLGKGGDKHPGILEGLGDAIFQTGDKAKAVEFWQKALQIRKSAALEQKIQSVKM